MTPIFVTVLSTGALWVSNDVTFNPAGTIVKQFRINPNGISQKVVTLTGSGNASASALAAVLPAGGPSGKPEGNEVH